MLVSTVGVVVLTVAAAERLDIKELRVVFGTRKHFCYLAAHGVVEALSLGAERCAALPCSTPLPVVTLSHSLVGMEKNGLGCVYGL